MISQQILQTLAGLLECNGIDQGNYEQTKAQQILGKGISAAFNLRHLTEQEESIVKLLPEGKTGIGKKKTGILNSLQLFKNK